MSYAYRDKYKLLRVVDDLHTAKELATGKIVEYQGACIDGYPAIQIQVISSSDGRVYVGGNEKNGIIDVSKLPEVIANEVKELLSKIGI